MLKIRLSRDRLIFNTGIPTPEKDGLYIETGPCLYTENLQLSWGDCGCCRYDHIWRKWQQLCNHDKSALLMKMKYEMRNMKSQMSRDLRDMSNFSVSTVAVDCWWPNAVGCWKCCSHSGGQIYSPLVNIEDILPKGPYLPCVAWRVGPFWQDTLDIIKYV